MKLSEKEASLTGNVRVLHDRVREALWLVPPEPAAARTVEDSEEALRLLVGLLVEQEKSA